MSDTRTETQTPVAFEVHAEIEIDAPSDVVWRALVDDVGSWWVHGFRDGSRISLEPWIGGRFMEEWEGGGALTRSRPIWSTASGSPRAAAWGCRAPGTT